MAHRKNVGPAHGIDSKTAHFFVRGGMPKRAAKPLTELTAADKAKVAEHAANLKKHAPEFYDFVKDAIKEGMVPGLRNVRVKVHTK